MSSPLFRWVAERAGSLEELLREQGSTRALGEGRVFVDGRRAGSVGAELAPGAVVEVFAPRPEALIQVLRRVDGVIAVHKPAALPTEPDESGNDCVLRQLAEALKLDPGELLAVSRLDVGVSGVLLVASDARARARLLQERARGGLRRRYVALACGVPAPERGEWRDSLGRGGGGKRVVDARGGRSAHTRYRVVATAGAVSRERPATSLLALSPVTGRTHQLRVHAAAHGAPLLGDRKYSGPARMTLGSGRVESLPRILLHAASVEWGAPGARERVVSEPGTDFLEAWLALGGDAGALSRALD